MWKKYANNYQADLAAKPLTGTRKVITMALIFAFSFIFSFGINWIGFKQFNVLFILTWIVFALSLVSNILNAMKLSLQNSYWILYDVVQFVKAIVMGNWANVGKYIYYTVSMIASWFYWSERNPQENQKSFRQV